MMRRQFVNDPHDIVREALEGFARANAHLVRWDREGNFVARAQPAAAGKVGLVAGGGSGHEPLHGGFVGVGMLDAAVPGAIFSCPTAAQIRRRRARSTGRRRAAHRQELHRRRAQLRIAAELAAEDGIEVERVLVDDDLATDIDDDRSPGGAAPRR